MSSRLSLHAAPAAGFDEPFAMLSACHERVERMLQLLERLQGHLARSGADAQAAQAARDLMRYFDLAGPAHHEDEERHLLPLLLQHADPALPQLARCLMHDHHRMAADWAQLRADLQSIAPGPQAVVPAAARLRAWPAFAALYRAHIRLEEEQAYPAVQALISPQALAEAGREMAARRGAPSGVGAVGAGQS